MRWGTGRRWLALLVAAGLIPGGVARAAEQEGWWLEVYEIAPGAAMVPQLVGQPAPNVARGVPVLDLTDDRQEFGELVDNFLAVATARLVITEAGDYTLRLSSDDGSLLWLNGQLLIDNDGLHGPVPRDATLRLTPGSYGLMVQMFERTGGATLRLEWQRPGSNAFEVLPAAAVRCTVPAEVVTAPGVKPTEPRLLVVAGDGTPLAGINPGYERVGLRPAGYEPAVATLAWDGDAVVVTDAAGARTRVSGVLGERPTVAPAEGEAPAGPAPGLTLSAGQLWQAGQPVCVLPAEVLAEPRAVAMAPAGWFEGQAFVADPVGGGVGRVFLETVEGQTQGTVFRFTQGLEAAATAVLFAPDASLIIGGAEGRPGLGVSGLERLVPRAEPAFELQAVRAKADGLEVEFTRPLAERAGWDPFDYRVTSWALGEGTAREDERRELIGAAHVSADRRRVFVALPELRAGRQVHLRVDPRVAAEDGTRLWSTEAWVTLRHLGTAAGERTEAPEGALPNTLTVAERQTGWQLLFDGQTSRGWRGFRREGFPDGWVVENGTLHHVKGGGDLITEAKYANFELELEYRLTPGTNSGLMYRVSEDVSPSWHTGPEVQILDEAPNQFGKHSAGALYDLLSPRENKQVRPAGEWNRLRLVVDGDHVEHWLNGQWILSYTLGDAAWDSLVKASKFAELPRFGREPEGHLCLQDHGQEMWFRNLKLRVLPAR